jgi:hypothetical protein
MADSIAGTVTAMICVVVGLLIIGCALVPVVEQASTVRTDETITTEVSGYNHLNSETNGWFGLVDEVTIATDGTTITVNGETFTENYNPSINSAIGYLGNLAFCNVSNNRLIVTKYLDTSLENSLNLSSGTAVYDGSVLTITGITTGSVPYTYSSDFSQIYAKIPVEYFTEDETEWYGTSSSPIIIGEGQRCISNSGSTVIETTTTEVSGGITMVNNDDHTATLTFESGTWYGPYKWVGYTTTTETTTTESEYAALYAIIPIMCILGMAYVLIRRF